MEVNEDLILIKKAQQKDEKSLEQLVLKHQNLVHALLKKYRYYQIDYEELVSVANVGLIKAIQNFDFSYQTMFSTYSVPLIMGEIKKYFRDQTYLHISRSVKELYLNIVNYQNEYESVNFKSPTINEISDHFQISNAQVIEAIEAFYNVKSLDDTIMEDDSISYHETISKDDPFLEKFNLKLALESLDKKEQLIIHLRYYKGLNQEEVARRLFVSQVQISRMEKKIIEKLKSRV